MTGEHAAPMATGAPSQRTPTSGYAILAGAAVCLALIVWLLAGQPGAGLEDGTYACGAVTATVDGGRLVTVSAVGADAPAVATWDGARRTGDHRFTVDIENSDGSAGTIDCVAL